MSSSASLFAITEGDGSRADSHSFAQLRNLDEAEFASIDAARSIAAALLKESAEVFRVQAARDQFFASVARQFGAMTTEPDQGRSQFGEISTQFATWLASVRSFDDRTSHWISNEYGKESETYSRFKASLSEEWDNNAGYRLATALRNAATHAGDVLTDCRVNAVALPDWSSRYELIIGISGPRLVDRVGSYMNAKVRRELAACEATIHAVNVVVHATNACVRAHGCLVQSLRSQIEASRSLLQRIVAEVETAAASTTWAGIARLVVSESLEHGRIITFEDLAYVGRGDLVAMDDHLAQLPAVRASAADRATLDDLLISPDLSIEVKGRGGDVD